MLALGIAAASEYAVAVNVCSVLAALFVLAASVRMQKKRCKRLLLGGALLLIFLSGSMRLIKVQHRMEAWCDGLTDAQQLSVQGKIFKKQFKNTQWSVHLKDCCLSAADGVRPCGRLIVYLDENEPVLGNTVIVQGTIHFFDCARNKGNFDERAYYQNQGYTCRVYADAWRVARAHKDIVRETLWRLQQKLFCVYGNTMPKNEAGALGAMLLGEKSMLAPETKTRYRQSGIAHILAISGLHISIIGMLIFRLLRKSGVAYAVAAPCAFALVLLFGLMTGMSVSTARAVCMFGLYLFAACVGRAYDSANALAVTAFLLLLANPCALFLAGFQFSFAAVLGVLMGGKLCAVCRPRLRVGETVLISLGIQLMTLPLTAFYYFEIPVYAVLLNMLVLPCMELVMVAGLFGGVFGLFAFSGAAGVFAGLSKCLLALCTVLLRYFSAAGAWFLRLPGAVHVTGQPAVAQLALSYALVGVCIAVVHLAGQRAVDENTENTSKKLKRGLISTKKPACKRAVRLNIRAVTALAAGCLCSISVLLFPLPKEPQVAVLDVGQGDGIYIHTSDGSDMFIDGGSVDVKEAGTYRILPFLKAEGVAGVDCWFLSHLDADHVSGFSELMESGYPVGTVVLAKEIVQDDAYRKLTAMLASARIPVRYLGAGDSIGGKRARFTCLFPTGACEEERNARSLVLRYTDGAFTALFPGDFSADEEKLLVHGAALSHVSLYKAAHHGSRYSNSDALLARLSPQLSIISCAAKNRFGHPGAEALLHMRAHSASVRFTMEGGQQTVRWKEGRLQLTQFCPVTAKRRED